MVIFTDNALLVVKLHALAFALLPFVIWAAIRFGTSGASLATLLIATIATVETGMGYGPFAQNSAFVNAVLLDVFFGVLSISGMVVAGVIAEREHAHHTRERLVREQAEMETRLRFATIVEASNDAIIGMDIDGIITDWNKGAERTYGYSTEEVIGQSIFLLIPPERSIACGEVMKKVQQGQSVCHYETVRRKKDGTFLDVSITGSPVYAPDGRIVGLSCIDRDITERKFQETILRESEERFRMAAHAGKMFAYEWDAASDVIVRSEESAQILGVDKSLSLTGKRALEGIHPDDRERVVAALNDLTPEKPYLQVSYRIRRPDDSEIWVERSSVAHFDAQGKIQRIVGMVADITERKRAELALSQARLRLIDAQEQERSRIARELHDDIGQRMALLTIEMERLQQSQPGLTTDVRSGLEQLRSESAEIAADIQSLSHELHSARLEYLGIAAAIKGFCREFSEKQQVQIDFKTHNMPGSLRPDIPLCLFRVLQEALHNSAKHSGAESFEVCLWAKADEIHLTVMDSGAGFDSDAALESRGIGLISMQERLDLVNGTLSIDSAPHRGTTIHARVPLVARGSLQKTG